MLLQSAMDCSQGLRLKAKRGNTTANFSCLSRSIGSFFKFSYIVTTLSVLLLFIVIYRYSNSHFNHFLPLGHVSISAIMKWDVFTFEIAMFRRVLMGYVSLIGANSGIMVKLFEIRIDAISLSQAPLSACDISTTAMVGLQNQFIYFIPTLSSGCEQHLDKQVD